MEEVLEEWLEREKLYVEKALETARVYEFAVPDPSRDNYTDHLIGLMENRADEREFFIKDSRYRHGDLDIDDDPLNRDSVRSPDSLGEMFCDECTYFSFRVAIQGEKHVCTGCWNDGGWENQSELGEFTESEQSMKYVLVGCGDSKKNGEHPAKDIYKSVYFQKKREFAENLGDDWRILSAKHAVLDPDRVIEEYDVAIDDVDVEAWLDRVEAYTGNEINQEQGDEVWVLAGKRYVNAEDSSDRSLRSVLNGQEWTAYFPFDDTSGIGEQNGYLAKSVNRDVLAMPGDLEE